MLKLQKAKGTGSLILQISFCASQMHRIISPVYGRDTYINFTALKNCHFHRITASLEIGFLFFNVPFNAVSPNPVHS